jgi:hypothetical protein
MSIIYKTTNSINGKIYIGKAKFNDPNYLGSGILLAKAIKKYKRESFIKERQHIMSLFGRKGVVYDFGPGPTIWSSKVWKSLEDNYIAYNNTSFSKLIEINGSEFTWYGEWLLYSQEIRLMPKGPLFKNYHYVSQFEYDKQHGYNLDKISKLYLGVGMQSIYNFNI